MAAETTVTLKDATGTNFTVPVDTADDASLIPIHSSDNRASHYHYAVGNITPVATPTAVFIIQGSSTRTVRVKKIRVSGGATAAGSMLLKCERWSSAGTAGSATLTAITAALNDTRNTAASATVSYVQTANYTTEGTSAGLVAAGRLNLVAIGSAATSSDCVPYCIDFTTNSDQALVLQGTSQYLVVGGAGSALPSGAKFDFIVEVEESSDT